MRVYCILSGHDEWDVDQLKLLVTGCSGFIGGHLIPRLADRGHAIVGLDIRACKHDFGDFFEFVQADINDTATVEQAMSGVDGVIHLAAEHTDFGVTEDEFHNVNVEGTKSLLAAATRHDIDHFVFYSSVAVYGDKQEATHESASPSPASPYGRSKLAAEHEVQAWCEAGERRALVVRPAVIHGPNNYANMFRLLTQIASRRYVHVGDGSNVKSIGYVENLADATIYLMTRQEVGMAIYNYADEPHLTSRQIADTLAEALGLDLPRIAIPRGLAMATALPLDLFAKLTGYDVPVTAYRIRKLTTTTRYPAKKLLDAGFSPAFSATEGLRRTATWFASLNGNEH